jgi:hypothetical protein
MQGKRASYLVGTVVTGLISGAAQADITEGFDSVTGTTTTVTTPAGWFWQNNSDPVNAAVNPWFQGNPAVFVAHEGAETSSYAGCNFQRGTGTSTLSVWFGTPAVTLAAGTEIRFWTRTISDTFPDRLQVRLSLAGESTDVGKGDAFAVGDFTTLLLDINPDYGPGYPLVWTEQVITLTAAQVPAPTTGRIAFRYFVEDGGPSGANSNYMGIDTFSLTDPSACPADITGDGATDVNDLLILIGAYGATPADPEWVPEADFVPDNVIDVNDLLVLIGDYNCGL